MVDQGFPERKLESVISNGTTPLMQASCLGDFAMVKSLLAAGANIGATNNDGNNALWLACYSGNIDIIGLLLEYGADLNHQNDGGASCLMYAASSGKTAVVAKLLEAGADNHLKTLDDFTALDMAANIECLDMLRAAVKSCKGL